MITFFESGLKLRALIVELHNGDVDLREIARGCKDRVLFLLRTSSYYIIIIKLFK